MCSEEKLKRENWWIVNVWSLSFLIWAKTGKLKMSHSRTSVQKPVQSVITHLISRMCIRQIVTDHHCCWCPQWLRLNFNKITWTLGWHNNNTFSDKLWTITMHSSICPQGQITLQEGPGATNSHGPCWPAPSLDVYGCCASNYPSGTEHTTDYKCQLKLNYTVFSREMYIPTSYYQCSLVAAPGILCFGLL